MLIGPRPLPCFFGTSPAPEPFAPAGHVWCRGRGHLANQRRQRRKQTTTHGTVRRGGPARGRRRPQAHFVGARGIRGSEAFTLRLLQPFDLFSNPMITLVKT